MKIKCSNKGVKWIFNREISEDRIVFDKGGNATVSAEVGEKLVKLYSELTTVKHKATSKED